MSNASPRTVKIAFLAIAAIIMNVFAAIITFDPEQPNFLGRIISRNRANQIKDFKTFASEDDFKNYLALAPKEDMYFGGGSARALNEALPPDSVAKNAPMGLGGSSEPARVSQTNVQVLGIDEPDIVKTNGKEIYFSGAPRLYYSPMMKPSVGQGISSIEQERMIRPDINIMPPVPKPTTEPGVNIIKAFPPADLALEGKVGKQGDLLLNNNILMIFSGQEITGFNVVDPKSPKQKWNMKIGENTSIVASRLYGDKVYLITQNRINVARPCPVKPFSIDGVETNIRCQDIYYPVTPVNSDSTFTAIIVNPLDGKIEKTVSFIGSSNSSIIYMSENSIYTTYLYSESATKFFVGFMGGNSDLFPAALVQKMQKLDSYDISENSKMSELSVIMDNYSNSLDRDARMKLENEVQNRMVEYYSIHRRELEKTGIIKIDIKSLTVAASGSVPGRLLNNFSIDEYNGYLRVASTIGARSGIFSDIGRGQSVSDVSILDEQLSIVGAVKDLGKTERIYSARFIEDKAYIVTFRQTDPFYVLDLSNPKKPVMAGELKIPGFSSYLHPLDATHILGVGMESGKVKISLFDVTDKNNPVELDKYLLDEYWTEVSNNYHAFLLDSKHKIFFLPGSKGGYVFSYKFSAECSSNFSPCPPLALKKAISQNSVKRAIYLNDYLYIIGEDKIIVLNELDWEKVNELDLNK